MPPEHHETQPSAEIVRVEGAKCRRECVLARSRATLCGDRARRGREMEARARFGPVRRNPLRRSCASRARNAGESAFWPGRGQPSAEIVRVEGAKCVLDLARATLCGDRACRGRETQARVHFDPVRRNPLRRSFEGAKRRRECVLARSGATLCGDRACRGGKKQARARFGFLRRSPLRRSCAWKARNAGERSEWPVCSTNVVGERAFRSWTQKWPVL